MKEFRIISITLALFLSVACELKFLPEEIAILADQNTNYVEKSMSYNDVTIKILGQSGKMEVTRAAAVTPTTDKETITITMSSLKEKDADGNEVGKGGDTKHSYQNFAQLDFTFSDFEDTNFSGVKCRKLKFGSPAGALFPSLGTTLNINVYLFFESGTVKTGNVSSFDVKKGTMKFSVDVNNWPFCLPKETCKDSTCCLKGQANEVGSFLDFEIEIKGDKTSKDKSGDKVMLGDNSQIVLPNEINVDGTWSTMPTGYPQQIGTEKTTYTFRFQKFSKTLSYDPLIEMHVGLTNSSIMKLYFGILLLIAFALF